MKKTLLLVLTFVCSIMLHAAVINVSSGTGTLKTAIGNAQAGDVLVLADGTYTESSNITVDKDLVIKAANDATPILTMSGRFTVNVNFTLQGCIIDGGNSTADLIRITGGSNLKVQLLDCTVRNNTGNGINFYKSDATSPYVDSLIVRGCYFDGAPGRAVSATSATTQVNAIAIQNCTFNALTAKDQCIYIAATAESPIPFVWLDHCTFYNCATRRSIYLADVYNAYVSNCIAACAEYTDGNKSYAMYGTSVISNSISYNIDTYLHSTIATNVSSQNPYFVDAANKNFQLYKNSPAVGFATDGGNLGDPRWGVSAASIPLSEIPYEPYKKPYSMSPTTSSVRILWQMPDTITTGVVRYGKTPALGDSVVSQTGWYVKGEGFVHVVELTGLEPFTSYYYQVGDSIRRFDPIHTAKTAPEKNTAFRLFMLSDIHVNARGIWKSENDNHIISDLHPDFGMFIGDFVNDGSARDWNPAFFTPGEPLLSQMTFSSAVGNHETGDPLTYRYPTYYDYFSTQSHGESEDSIKDPRGEAYFTFNYGDAKIIALNLNNDLSSPSFAIGSKQYQWLDSQLNNATDKWILIYAHVGIYTSGYHGQWSAEVKEHIAPLLEKYAVLGKHIIVFAGDDHSFEHLYKAGVHYVRPGCGRNANYAQVTSIVDAQYSLYYNQISCFSTLDMAADGESITLTARDSVGTEFYSYTFSNSDKILPSLYISQPVVEADVVDSVYIHWSCFDNSGKAKINLYYAPEADRTNGTAIVTELAADASKINSYYWNVRNLYPKGNYYIYGTINDGDTIITNYAKAMVRLVEDTIAPPAPTGMTGGVEAGKIKLSWKNPIHLVHLCNLMDDFEADITGFTASGDNGSAVLKSASGYNSTASLQVDYTVTSAWGEGSAVKKYDTAQNVTATPFLEFWYKGDGSSRALRLIIKTDINGDGTEDDWWYNESLHLNTTEWQKAKIDMRGLSALDWHANSMPAITLNNLISVSFIAPSATIGTGTFYLDSIAFSGDVFPAPDYAGTRILRRTDHYPANETDGDVIYNGTAEACEDATIQENTEYYYAAFAYDDKNNYSAYDAGAAWKYNNATTELNQMADVVALSFPNPFTENARINFIVAENRYVSLDVYNLTGELVACLVNDQVPAGRHSVVFDTEYLPSGLYLVKMVVDNTAFSKKLMLK